MLVLLDEITKSGLQLFFLKKLKSLCSLKGSLYRERELLNESGSWLLSFVYTWGRRKRVCKWVSVLVFIYTWKRIMSGNKWAWAFHKVLYDLV